MTWPCTSWRTQEDASRPQAGHLAIAVIKPALDDCFNGVLPITVKVLEQLYARGEVATCFTGESITPASRRGVPWSGQAPGFTLVIVRAACVGLSLIAVTWIAFSLGLSSPATQ